MSQIGTIVKNGLWDNNVIFAQLLGMCPLLGVSTNAINGIGMGLATTFVLVGSNIVVSLIRNYIPNDVRIPAYVIVIASFVTMIDLTMNAFFLDLHKVLGIFIPLIVVNCAILGRAEAFACKNTALASAIDGLAMGLGFTLALVILGSIREILGSGKFFGLEVMGASFHPAIGFILPPGAFIVLGFILMAVRWVDMKRAKK
ncbi:MAG: Ion-translocating oxidoreductase complex subunit E [Magnetococcales bacterium]|nr:Ion-translocating oxidoreductase complex subunit E [Magnetococcales bacterium]HIJ86017.1 electron transport complex subunit E [Magnetococcales bacterium]